MILGGAILAFLGFVCPGIAWCLKTPGDTEMISLTVALIVGASGIIVLFFGIAMSMAIILEPRT